MPTTANSARTCAGADNPHPHTYFQRLIGLNAVLDIDLRNRRAFTQRGVRQLARHDCTTR